MLITDSIGVHAARQPQQHCIVTPDGAITYAQFAALLNCTAHALLAVQERSQRPTQYQVALLLDNSIELLQTFYAAAAIGWLALVLDPKWPAMDLNAVLLESQPDVLLIQAAYLDRLGVLPPQTQVVVVSSPGAVPTSHQSAFPTLSQWIKPDSQAPVVQVADTSDFYVGYTSGTSGKPKGFVRHHRSWIASFQVSNAAFDIGPVSHVVAPGPLVHSLSLYAAASTLFAGGTFYLLHKFAADTLLALLSTYPISHLYVVPTMLEALFQQMQRTPTTLVSQSPCLISSGDKWNLLSKQRASALFPQAQLFEFYGASELSFVSILDPESNAHKPTSVGRPAATVRISLRDVHGNEVPQGEIGQVYVQSQMLFSGYYRNPSATQHVLHDGWATVGDLAWQDAEGFLYIAGRKQYMIISGGLNIYPAEVERVLLQLPAIAEALVLGLPDAYWGERVVALVTLKEGAALDVAAIKAYCKAHLPAYKCPQDIIHVAAFPHTLSGKIARDVVQQQLRAGSTYEA